MTSIFGQPGLWEVGEIESFCKLNSFKKTSRPYSQTVFPKTCNNPIVPAEIVAKFCTMQNKNELKINL